jgi:error-prone DNA polymerase
LGLDTVRGLGGEVSTAIVTARQRGAFRSLADLCRRGGLGRRTAEALILAGALDGWGLPRRQLVWDLEVALQEARSEPTLHLQGEDAPVFAALPNADRMLLEHRYTGVSASGHLYDVVARQLRTLGATLSGDLARWPAGTRVRVGGVVVARQQPPTANGMAFLAVEDTQGLINVAVSSEVLTACREAVSRRFIMVEGQVRWEGSALSITASRVVALAPLR